MKKHRVAVVGCGALAQLMHLPSCRENKRIELKAVCDVDAKTAEMCQSKFGAERAETNWRRIVDAKDIDLCILATHINLRGEFIIPALEKGKPVYTEKPLAPNHREMLDIARAVKRTGKEVCVGHNRRSSPAMLEFKRLIDKALDGGRSFPPTVDRSKGRGLIPEEKWMQLLIRVNDDSRSWKHWVFEEEDGVMYSEMVHFIDVSLWLNRGRPVKVFAEGSPRGNFTLVMRFDDGSMTTLLHTMVGHFDYPKELFEATAGHITVAMDQHIEVRQCGMDDEAAVKYFPYGKGASWAKKQGVAGYFIETERERRRAKLAKEAPRWLNVNKGHYSHLDRFLDHIEGKGENPCPVESAIPVNRIAMKFLESSRLGLPVAVGPEDWNLAV